MFIVIVESTGDVIEEFDSYIEALETALEFSRVYEPAVVVKKE